MGSKFNLFVNFWHTTDKNGSMTWSIQNNKISILYYFNDENIDLGKTSFKLSFSCVWT